MVGRRKSQLDDTFRFKDLETLEKRIAAQTTLEAVDYQRFIDQKIESLGARLALPLDAPTWGLSRREAVAAPAAAAYLPADTMAAINANAERSERYGRLRWLYAMATVLGLAVAGGALYFDYQIMTEFWTRVFANEFMEVPESLAGSVISKSAQVVFATVAFHFMISSLSDAGRRIFIWLFFILTFGMIAGFGLLNAYLITPPDTPADRSAPGPTTLDDALQSLGLSGDAAAEDSPDRTQEGAPPPDDRVRGWILGAGPMLWLLVPGTAFLAVTGIGALSVHLAETNLSNFVRAGDFRRRRRNMGEFENLHLYKTLIDRMVGRPQAYLDSPQTRRAHLSLASSDAF